MNIVNAPTPRVGLGDFAGPIGAGIEAGGSIIASLIGAQSAKDQMKFQERMSSTAHQREVNDMIKAGINPALSVMGGHGASTPVGTSFTPDNPARGMAATLLQSALQKHQLVQMDAQADNQYSQASAADAAAKQAEAAAEREKATARNIDIDTKLKGFQINGAKAESELYSGNKGFILKAAEPFYNAAKSIFPWVDLLNKPKIIYKK